jgi:2'-5' RNA ligase
MIPVNITLTLKNDFKKLNESIYHNKINFDSNHIPHITLLQFFTHVNNIKIIQNELDKIDFKINIEKFNLSVKKYNKKEYIYKIQIKSEALKKLHLLIFNKFKKYIESPKLLENFGEEINNKLIPTTILNYYLDNSQKNFDPHITIGISDNLSEFKFSENIKINDINLYRIGDGGTAMPLHRQDVFYFAHRINNTESLKKIPKKYGIELDLRDYGKELMLEHDPFTGGERFEDFLKSYNKSSIILNIKSERIEYKVLELLKKFNITEYFFLDSSFPMIYTLSKEGEKNIAIRFSEYESIESVLLMKDKVKWVWIDCFNNFSLNQENYKKIKNAGLKICLVSPELQKHNINRIEEFKEIIYKNNFKIDAICTKVYNVSKWNL